MKPASVTELQRRLEAEFNGRLAVPGSEVPRTIDFAVLAAARRASTARRRMRWLRRFAPFAAAAAMLLAFGIFQYRQSSPAPASGGDEALALLDWSKVEQESYNLSSELNSRQLTMSQWN